MGDPWFPAVVIVIVLIIYKILIIYSVDCKELFVNKTILASRSEISAAMFNDSKEKLQTPIRIENIDCEFLKEMFRFM